MLKAIKGFLAIAAAAMITTTVYGSADLDFYNNLSEELNIIRVYETDDLDYETLVNRNGNIVIEKIIGLVLNDDGDGKILNTESEYDYISYNRVEGAKAGDIILTYCIYNPDTAYEDDILERFDYIIDRAEN